MTSGTDHPFVTRYLQQFDEAAASISGPRRAVLREEIAAHLRDAIPADATNADAAAAISDFGSPAEILGQELDSVAPGNPAPRPSRKTRNTVLIVISAITVALLLIVLLPLLFVVATASKTDSVVKSHPVGPARITEGTGYYEYQAAIKAMADPLPAGAEYPDGVPAGLDSGSNSSGIMEAGAGKVVAHFTWLCAWESEYLSAISAKDAERQVAAESMLIKWSTSPFYLDVMSDPDKGWVTNVINPMKFGDASGVKQDRPQTCAQASIVNVGP